MKVPPMAEEEPLQGVAQVLHQVEPIDDLHRVGGAKPNPFGVQSTPIPADDLDAGIRLQPLRNGQGRALGEQIKHLMALEITDDRPKAPASPPGPLVEPDHAWGRNRGKGGTMDETHHRPVTSGDAQRMREPGAGTAAHRQAHVPEGRTRAQTMAATGSNKGRIPLGKNALRTAGMSAEETTDLQMQEKLRPGNRQVGHRAPVDTVHRSRAVLTARTCGSAPPAAEVNMPYTILPAMGPQAKAGEVRQQSVS
jgi:hypothetical protein